MAPAGGGAIALRTPQVGLINSLFTARSNSEADRRDPRSPCGEGTARRADRGGAAGSRARGTPRLAGQLTTTERRPHCGLLSGCVGHGVKPLTSTYVPAEREPSGISASPSGPMARELYHRVVADGDEHIPPPIDRHPQQTASHPWAAGRDRRQRDCGPAAGAQLHHCGVAVVCGEHVPPPVDRHPDRGGQRPRAAGRKRQRDRRPTPAGNSTTVPPLPNTKPVRALATNTSPAESTATPSGQSSDPGPLAGQGNVIAGPPPAGNSTTVLLS